MKRIAVAVLGAAVLVGVLTGPASGHGSPTRVIKLKELVDGRTFGAVDNAPAGVSVGDSIAFSRIVARRSGERVGRIDVTCTTTAGETAETAHQACHGVLTLNDGQLALETAIEGVPTSAEVAVTGGTGAYFGASGVMTSVVQPDTSELVTVKLRR
jgi:hypothetical protein